ncbi:DNRLRE domain-containing protein [Micromonospora sp. NBC_01796]|uniref:DNRLRE domain-containing protein n=1 Tax=Micromonospora sp. NBC_01796 TaxID=2975987 RepID=UPI002DDB549E|nr:DNRLRE domain-containing protein [Micromonospora sp. NBC_01796]WSA89150.1 DNRLRE domain-containing protein [Micromonospora sp. NBC_01796]
MIGRVPRQGLVPLLALSVGLGGLAVFATSGAANAAPHNGTPASVQLGYTDSAHPKTAYDAGNEDLPLGSWRDAAGVRHTSRVYATFDLSAYQGKKIYSGSIFLRESSAADCSKRAIEIWRTKPVDATPTWKRAPEPLVRTDEILTPDGCPSQYLNLDVSAAVQDAVRQRQQRITFEIRVPQRYENDPTYGRKLYWYSPVRLSVQFNSVPTVDNNHLYNGGFPCTTSKPYPRIGSFANSIQAVGTDADAWDERAILTTAAIWPVDQPRQRTEFTGDFGTSGRANGAAVPANALVDGVTYAWQARAGDGADLSAWSKKCYFTYDVTRPPTPMVSSSNYPHADTGEFAPVGVPGRFTFSGNGNRDVAGFAYSWSEPGVSGCSYSEPLGQLVCTKPFDRPDTVRANTPGGSVTVSLSPERSGFQRLYVYALDLAGNSSPWATYEMYVPFSAPNVSVVDGPPEWGSQVHLRLSPATGLTVTGYEYKLDGGEPQTLPAGADGVAHLFFPATNTYGHRVEVRSRGANGFRSDSTNWTYYFGQRPGVRSTVYPPGTAGGGVGVPGDFTFTPVAGWTDTSAYRYSFDGAEPTEVPAGQDGRATITWAPTTSGWHELEVYAVRADGSVSYESNWYSFLVAEGT